MFEFNLVKGADEGVPKLPLACLYITEIARKDRNSNSVVTLMNENFQLKGTISKSVTKDHWDKLSVGAVLLLQNVFFFFFYLFYLYIKRNKFKGLSELVYKSFQSIETTNSDIVKQSILAKLL